MANFDDFLKRCFCEPNLPTDKDYKPTLSFQEASEVLYKVIEIFSEEPNVLHIDAPINVCGDIHGQWYDFRSIFDKVTGHVSTNKSYLFLGDYVDRGYFSVETILTLFCLKIKYPRNLYLLRGNHECRSVTQSYGFFDECLKKYDNNPSLYRLCMEAFDRLPIAAIIDDRLWCVHGGLSESTPCIDNVQEINRVQEIPGEGPFADLLWSDPNPRSETWESSYRGAGCLFGRTVVNQFLRINDLEMVVRAHQLAPEGFAKYFDDKLVTVWSAPNYSYKGVNKAAVMTVEKNVEPQYVVFDAVPDNERKKPKDIPTQGMF